MPKWEELYKDSAKIMKRKDTATDLQIIAKEPSQYTFQPNKLNTAKQLKRAFTTNELQYSTSARKKAQLKPKLDQGKSVAAQPQTERVSEQSESISDDDDEANLQISVNIGQRKL